MNKGSEGAGEAIVDVVEQSHDDDKSLRRRQGLDSMEKYWLDLKLAFSTSIYPFVRYFSSISLGY